MTSPIKLTDTQRTVLHDAATHTDRLVLFPRSVQGGARAKVLNALLLAELIYADRGQYRIADAGYRALGMEPPASTENTNNEAPPPARRKRRDTKQEQVIQLLRRPEGATIAQICALTKWLPHTVRGTFAGALKKNHGVNIVSEKPADGERVYRIV